MAVSTHAQMNARIKDRAMYDLAMGICSRTSDHVYWLNYGERVNLMGLTGVTARPSIGRMWWWR